MIEISAVKLSRSENDAEKELRKIINMMFFTRFIKGAYNLEDIVLIYLPYYIADFEVEIIENKKNMHEHVYMSLDVGRQTRVKALSDIDGLIVNDIKIPHEMIAACDIDENECVEKLRQELVYRYIPRNTKKFKARQVEMVEAKLIYRPQYLLKYKLFGKTRIYKTNGDIYNL